MERLDKLISSQRADGRKEVQKLIKSGAVLVNGKICKKPDTKVDPDKDEIVVDGQALNYSKHIYIMMNKPAGVVSATEDSQFKTVIDLIPEDMKRKGLFPVGRLDRDTEGLLLITDDGDFAHSITSPKKHVDKKYVAKLDGEITEDTVKRFSDGITTERFSDFASAVSIPNCSRNFFSSPSLSTREYSPVLSLTAVSGNREFIATVTAVHIIAAVTNSTAAKITVFLALIFKLKTNIINPPHILFSDKMYAKNLRIIPFVRFQIIYFVRSSKSSAVVFTNTLPPSFFMLSRSP